ncbi:hypothetical protein WP1_103 [Pseudomonas phage WP1]
MSTSAALLAAIISSAVFPPSTIQCPEENRLRPSVSTIRKTANSFLTHKKDNEP